MRLLVILLLFPLLSYGQADTLNVAAFERISNDSITIAKTTLIKAGKTIKLQRDTINHQKNIIGELHNQNQLQSIVLEKTNIELELMIARAEISDGIIDRYQQHVKKERWFDKTWIHVSIGFFGALTTSVIVRNITK